jgi:hypothetical protein
MTQQMFGTATAMADDYDSELARMGQGGNYLKFKSGTPYSLVLLDGGTAVYKKKFPGNDTEKECKDFHVRVSGGEYSDTEKTWTITLGGKQSLAYMVLKVLSTWKKTGKPIVGATLHVGCNGEGRDRKYVVKEFTELENNAMFANLK